MKKNLWFWVVGLGGLIIDQITKYWAVKSLITINTTVPLWPDVFHFTYVINTGAAFSFFEGGVGWLRWLSLGVSLVLIAIAWWGEKMKITEQLGYGFILSGALGNGLDRFLFGYVVDFLDFRLIDFPVFNLADVFINIGIIFLLISSWSSRSSSKSSH